MVATHRDVPFPCHGVVPDQDLSTEDLQQRRADQAVLIQRAVPKLFLGEADDIAWSLRATEGPGRPRPERWFPSLPLEREHAKQPDAWWRCFSETGHPLAPPGLELGRAINMALLATERLERPYAMGHVPYIDIVEPQIYRHPLARTRGHTYGRRDDFIEVQQLPPGFLFKPEWKHIPRNSEQWRDLKSTYPGRTNAQIQDLLDGYRNAYALLARHDPTLSAHHRSKRAPVHLDARAALGKPWYWPLQIISTSSRTTELLDEAGRFARWVCHWKDRSPQSADRQTLASSWCRAGPSWTSQSGTACPLTLGRSRGSLSAADTLIAWAPGRPEDRATRCSR